MKKILLTLSGLLISITTMAGDGGFFLQTCISESGRTNLTIYKDNYSGAKIPNKVVFGIDGQFITYAPEVDKCMGPNGTLVEDDCLTVETDPILYVRQGDAEVMTVTFGDSMTASINKGFYDPRPDYDGVNVGTIQLTCKEYYQGP